MMKILRRIGICFIVLILLTYVFIVISPRIFAGFYPFGIKTAIVLTGSMEPEIEINDFVIMKKPDNFTVGDIVSYREDSVRDEVLHRIIKIDGDKIITKGDANNTNDEPIEKSQITGVYIGKIGGFGKIISFITRPIVFSIIITGLFVLFSIPDMKKSKDKKGSNHEK